MTGVQTCALPISSLLSLISTLYSLPHLPPPTNPPPHTPPSLTYPTHTHQPSHSLTHRRIGTFVVWDYVVFAGMLLISAVIGIYYAFAGRGQKTSKDFLMGGRRMTAVPVAMSLTASFMSAVTVLGTPSEVYRFGAIFSI